jgi:hypothetical protein
MSIEPTRHRIGRLRALAGVLALYGVLLQAFLTGLSPVPAIAAGPVLCAAQGPGPGAPVAHNCHACCAVACSGLSTPPVPAAAPAWPLRPTQAVVWRAGFAPLSRGPPARAATARGPPAA